MKIDMTARLLGAREYLELAIIEACLEVLDLALRLEHADLADEPRVTDRAALKYARRVTRSAASLREAIADYRRVVDAELDAEADGLPF